MTCVRPQDPCAAPVWGRGGAGAIPILVLSSRVMGVFLLFDTGGRTGISQARSNLHSRAEAGGDLPLQGLVRVMALVPAWSRVWVVNSRASVCIGPPTPSGPPPFPLLPDPPLSPCQHAGLWELPCAVLSPACHACCCPMAQPPWPSALLDGAEPRSREGECPQAGRAKPGTGNVAGCGRERGCTVILALVSFFLGYFCSSSSGCRSIRTGRAPPTPATLVQDDSPLLAAETHV